MCSIGFFFSDEIVVDLNIEDATINIGDSSDDGDENKDDEEGDDDGKDYDKTFEEL